MVAMIWGCMTAHGPGFMCKLEGTMVKETYKSVLQDELARTIDYYGLDPQRVIFQHDNDLKHTVWGGWVQDKTRTESILERGKGLLI